MTARIDGIALGSVAAGSVLLYAGITGRSIPAALQAIISGKPPSSAPRQYGISGTPAGAGATGSSGVNSAPAPSGSESSWITSMLAAIGAPATAANISSVTSWISREGPFASSDNNPLNTTLANAGSTGTKNSVGVQKFATASDGVNATAATLEGGSYGDILLLLRSGSGLCGRTLAGLSTWSGGGYSSVC